MEHIGKITEGQIAQYGVVASPDILTGTPAQNKAEFDRLVRELVAVVVNELVDAANTMMDSESTREEAEDGREAAETERVSAETARAAAEAKRVSAESGRNAAETERAAAEEERAAAEAARKSAESERASAETARSDAEGARGTAEAQRIAAEQARSAAEQLRQSAENARTGNEAARAAAETARVQAEAARAVFQQWNAEVQYATGNKVANNGSSYRATAASLGIEPPNESYWMLIAAKGDPGQRGPAGPGTGDMLANIYDTKDKRKDIFDYADGKAKEAENNAKTASVPLAQKGTASGVATLDGAGRLEQSEIPNIDCGVWDTTPVAEHNAAAEAHQNLLVDGNNTTAVKESATLNEHMANPMAHQNLVIDGNAGQ